jgi:virulence-associated protein VapD
VYLNRHFIQHQEELLYNIYLKLQDMNSLQESDINTLAKLNAILTDADLMKVEDITLAINAIKGNVPDAGNTLEKIFNIIQGFTYLKAEDIDTLAELNAILSDADIIKTEDYKALSIR